MPGAILLAPPSPATAQRPRAGRIGTHLLVPGLVAAGIALWDPARHGGPVLCPFRALTGHACPGCGLTRSAGAFLRGRAHDAFAFHPLGPVLVVELALACVVLALVSGTVRARVPAWIGPAVLVVNAVALLALWVARSATGQLSGLG